MSVSIDLIPERLKTLQALPHRLTPRLTTGSNLQGTFDLPLHHQLVRARTAKGDNVIEGELAALLQPDRIRYYVEARDAHTAQQRDQIEGRDSVFIDCAAPTRAD
ncbi:hypothetical protein ACNFRX_33020 [Streptomyces griseoaurantiacus]|uniref:hypothetical protein n=1 Tax=Streptomyces griseoaurantiacus TaxID=68213 RepID=UPI003F1B57A9